MDFNKPCEIQEDFLCLYLLNFTHLLGMCLFLERKISLHSVLAGLPGFARDSCSIIMSICAFHFYIIYFHFFSADHGIPQTFDYILTT